MECVVRQMGAICSSQTSSDILRMGFQRASPGVFWQMMEFLVFRHSVKTFLLFTGILSPYNMRDLCEAVHKYAERSPEVSMRKPRMSCMILV